LKTKDPRRSPFKSAQIRVQLLRFDDANETTEPALDHVEGGLLASGPRGGARSPMV